MGGYKKIVNMTDHKRIVNHDLCRECPKNGVSCLENDDICMPLEMFVQISLETSVLRKFEYLDNVAARLDLDKSFK